MCCRITAVSAQQFGSNQITLRLKQITFVYECDAEKLLNGKHEMRSFWEC